MIQDAKLASCLINRAGIIDSYKTLNVDSAYDTSNDIFPSTC